MLDMMAHLAKECEPDKLLNVLGHKNIKNTLVYTPLVNLEGDEYVSKVAWNLEEACKLVDAGFDYVTDVEGARLFRKRK
jgi:hypothetical protein